MAPQGPRGSGRGGSGTDHVTGAHEDHVTRAHRDPDRSLVRIHDPAGRPRGAGFPADHQGTVLTSHEAVDGLSRLVLSAGDRTRVVTADAVTPLPALNLALVRVEGLGAQPLPIAARDRIDTGAYVRIPAGGWREARVLGTAEVTYAATDRSHLLGGVLELAIGTAGRDALRPGGGAAGGPVLDADTGAVVAVLGTALHSDQRDRGFAVPLAPHGCGPLADLLVRNAATVPAYGTDLNLAGVLELTATSVAQDGPPGALGGPCVVAPVERADVARELASYVASDATVLGLVGAPGSGRTTELAALAARRGAVPAPTLWLRGADLDDTDGSLADAARRSLDRAARIVAASRSLDPSDLGVLSPDRLARVAARTGRPLLLLLDGPEEMPPVLAHRLPEWTEGTAEWLRASGARLVVGCREEYWEGAGAEFPPELLYGRDRLRGPLPACVRLADLTAEEARLARSRYGIPAEALTDRDAGHPLTLRLLAEIRAALPDAPAAAAPLDRHAVFAAHLDLMCLRIAVRLAAENGLRGSAVRRLAARVCGQVHEAARRSLGPGQGELDRESFEAVFPWGPAPARLGGGSGWASAVLTEGLLVPAGEGYRFAHEEFADWIQGMHLDLDEALHALVHRRHIPHTCRPLPVPHHRVGPVLQALLLLARHQGPAALARRLAELTHALDANPSWWAAHLLARTLLHVPDATPYADVLHLLADRVVAWRQQQRPVPTEFAPSFWTGLPLPPIARFDLLRRLVLADEAPTPNGGAPERADEGASPGPRYLDAAARLLAAEPAAVQPYLIRWFDDERPLPATPHATVATAAQALLHTHRHGALDDLTEALVSHAHPRGDELLTVLAEDEPSAVCRAVDRWAHDERPARWAAAVTYGLRAAPHADTQADRELLRYSALALLAQPADSGVHGGALALLVRDPRSRSRHLPPALHHFASGDPQIPPDNLVPALATHPGPVLDAFRARLRAGRDAGEALRALADVTTPPLDRRVAALVRETAELRPETAHAVAAYVDLRLDHGPTARAVLLPLVTGLLDSCAGPVRAALATILAAPGTSASRPLRDELLEHLLTHERDPAVLDALLHAAAARSGGAEGEGSGGCVHDLGHDDLVRDDLGHDDLVRDAPVRELIHRTGLLLVRTPDGATRFDRRLVDLGRHVPGFAARLARWLADTPEDWAAVVGPSTRRMIENLAGMRVPA
ncbi:trypsin-like peptidase domain-containing protein [Streptomyces sp. V3I7]|uniref:trypsin-like peptidase domain-containing protein n=1 Tax=Streptomyces sp. V3I7 TaxID=3042278 RepID=UPI0027821ADD|nr:trypsin-like peptidase domain-containing protein [Streptomyces sp. V3I7]MDQ0993379.1 hypothetical protein [Streptomyces sp. V3I7]